MSVILGLDPGSRITGFGVLAMEAGRLRCLDCGQVRAGTDAMDARLRRIHADVTALVAEFAPDAIAVERVFVARNPDSALKLGQARGVAIVAATAAGAALHEYTPTAIKQAVVGRGHAAKAQVQHMVQALLGLGEIPPVDAADALAVALCHAHAGDPRLAPEPSSRAGARRSTRAAWAAHLAARRELP